MPGFLRWCRISSIHSSTGWPTWHTWQTSLVPGLRLGGAFGPSKSAKKITPTKAYTLMKYKKRKQTKNNQEVPEKRHTQKKDTHLGYRLKQTNTDRGRFALNRSESPFGLLGWKCQQVAHEAQEAVGGRHVPQLPALVHSALKIPSRNGDPFLDGVLGKPKRKQYLGFSSSETQNRPYRLTRPGPFEVGHSNLSFLRPITFWKCLAQVKQSGNLGIPNQ